MTTRSNSDQRKWTRMFWLCEEHAEEHSEKGGECDCGLTPYVRRDEAEAAIQAARDETQLRPKEGNDGTDA